MYPPSLARPLPSSHYFRFSLFDRCITTKARLSLGLDPKRCPHGRGALEESTITAHHNGADAAVSSTLALLCRRGACSPSSSSSDRGVSAHPPSPSPTSGMPGSMIGVMGSVASSGSEIGRWEVEKRQRGPHSRPSSRLLTPMSRYMRRAHSPAKVKTPPPSSPPRTVIVPGNYIELGEMLPSPTPRMSSASTIIRAHTHHSSTCPFPDGRPSRGSRGDAMCSQQRCRGVSGRFGTARADVAASVCATCILYVPCPLSPSPGYAPVSCRSSCSLICYAAICIYCVTM
ncbi:hypothetical protein FB45DRAFT_280005 [Roridomyces roridus]|uniref:Uncharacterized protein n=1 Tax=Roridomyces roridus TaxID=1738132 RepID=A0AAD7CAX2_9AGAR|nr:hypothetical protein FB45DRAFT_280005 [Roridomyces roridus]